MKYFLLFVLLLNFHFCVVAQNVGSDRIEFLELRPVAVKGAKSAVIWFLAEEKSQTATTVPEYRFKDLSFVFDNGGYVSTEASILRIRLYYNDNGGMRIQYDSKPMLEVLEDIPIIIEISRGKSQLRFGFTIHELDAVLDGKMEGLDIRILTNNEAQISFADKEYKVLITNDLLGVRIRLQGMTNILDTMSRVMLNEGFFWHGKKYVFQDFDLVNAQISMKELGAAQKLYGYQKGSYVDMSLLKSYLEISPEVDYHILYFWAIWCQPCLAKMDETIELSKDVKALGNAEMFFISSKISGKKDSTTDFLLGKGVPQKDIVYFEKYSFDMADLNERKTIGGLLRVFSFPTYLVIREDGLIVQKGFDPPKVNSWIH